MANILEKIIQKRNEESSRLDVIGVVSNLFSELMEREKDVLMRRFGLKGDKSETLEKIGGVHNLTRERVRQIEAASIKKIKKLQSLEDYVSSVKRTVTELMEEHGGLIKKDYLLDILTVIALEMRADKTEEDGGKNENLRLSYRNHFDFILSKLLADDFELVKTSERFSPSFRVKGQEVSYLEDLADSLIEKVEGLKRTLKTEELIELLKQLDTYNLHQEKLKESDINIEPIFKSKTFPDKAEIINSNKILYSLMQSVKNIDRNKFGEWGISNWQEIKPKTVNDKIYLVLKHVGEPMHFTAIADKINEVKFDKKKANAATVHNELILDSRYILVGRGTYALKAWQK